MRYFVLTFGEYDPQSSGEKWEVYNPRQRNGYGTRREALEALDKARLCPEVAAAILARVSSS